MDQLEEAASAWRSADQEIAAARRDKAAIEERIRSAESARDRHAEVLMGRVGRNRDTRVFDVDGGHLIVRHEHGVRFVAKEK